MTNSKSTDKLALITEVVNVITNVSECSPVVDIKSIIIDWKILVMEDSDMPVPVLKIEYK